MSRRLLTLLAAASLLAAGCSTFSDAIDAINPFAASGPKMAPLTTFEAKVSVRDLWSTNIGKAGDYTFTPTTAGVNV